MNIFSHRNLKGFAEIMKKKSLNCYVGKIFLSQNVLRKCFWKPRGIIWNSFFLSYSYFNIFYIHLIKSFEKLLWIFFFIIWIALRQEKKNMKRYWLKLNQNFPIDFNPFQSFCRVENQFQKKLSVWIHF